MYPFSAAPIKSLLATLANLISTGHKGERKSATKIPDSSPTALLGLWTSTEGYCFLPPSPPQEVQKLNNLNLTEITDVWPYVEYIYIFFNNTFLMLSSQNQSSLSPAISLSNNSPNFPSSCWRHKDTFLLLIFPLPRAYTDYNSPSHLHPFSMAVYLQHIIMNKASRIIISTRQTF